MFIRRIHTFVLAAVASLALGLSAQAGIHTLVDGNSSATADTSSDAGFYSWEVDGVDNLYQQWFWYRLGSSGAASSVSTLPIDFEATADSNSSGNDDTLFVRYLNSTLKFEMTFSLQGGSPGSGSSDLTETLVIQNVSSSQQTLSFIQYSDFNLVDDSGGDNVTLINNSTIQQYKGASVASESTVVGPHPDYADVSVFPVTLNSLGDAGFTHLPIDLSSASFPQNFGPGDMTWAFEWVLTLDPNESFTIEKDKSLQIPEPASLALMGLGLALGLARRRTA